MVFLDFARKREAEWSGSLPQPHEIDNVSILDCVDPMDSREVPRHWREGGPLKFFFLFCAFPHWTFAFSTG